MKTRSILAAASLLAVGAVPATASADPVVRQATGTGPAAIQAAVDQFRTDLGGGTTAGQNGSFGGVRREINWDGVPDNVADPEAFPGGFFNSNSPRGVELATPGLGFVVSSDNDTPPDDDNDEVRFSSQNSDFENVFATFSAQRLFVPIDSTITETLFRVPGTDTPASTNGFGVVFTDVDAEGSAKLKLTGPNGEELGEFTAPATAGDGSLSFVGVSFDDGERIARARITSGTGNTLEIDEIEGNLAEDVTQGGAADLVVMDDFIYGEPAALGGGDGDDQAPEVSVKGAKRKLEVADLLEGLKLELTTDEEARLDVSLRAEPRSVELAKPSLVLAEKSRGLGSGTRKLTLKPKRRLLGGAERFKAELRVIATDRAGNRAVVKREIRVIDGG